MVDEILITQRGDVVVILSREFFGAPEWQWIRVLAREQLAQRDRGGCLRRIENASARVASGAHRVLRSETP